jgi:hypothetical protein
MKQPHAIVADDIHNVGSEYPDCTRDVIKFTMRVQALISEEGGGQHYADGLRTAYRFAMIVDPNRSRSEA